MKRNSKRSLLLVVSAPSGAGKTTLCRRLLDEFDDIRYSISCTTRAPREGEKNGKDYFFLTEDEFIRSRDRGEFLEDAVVHGAHYATPREHVLKTLGAGFDVLMDIDVQGAEKIREATARPEGSEIADAFVDIFVAPPDMQTLRDRLVGRAKDDRETIELRMKNAEHEMQLSDRYSFCIVNDELDRAYDLLRAIVLAERSRQIPEA